MLGRVDKLEDFATAIVELPKKSGSKQSIDNLQVDGVSKMRKKKKEKETIPEIVKNQTDGRRFYRIMDIRFPSWYGM